MTVLETKGLTKTYGKLKALDDLNLTIESGNVYGLLGPNGSGKTTTLGLILDILKPNEGSYEWFGGEYGDRYRLKVGAILETPNFYPYMNAVQNLEIVRQIKNVKDANFDELLQIVDLADRKRSKFRTYSLGMKQRLAIAATLIGKPRVLIFDEPTNGLDPQGIAEVRTILKRIADEGNTVILASHILDEVEKICSHVAIIKKGKLLKVGPVGSILSSDMTVEIATDDMGTLATLLDSKTYVKKLVREKDWIECTVDGELDARAFSKEMYDSGVIPTRLVIRKQRLEEEFLEITKNAN